LILFILDKEKQASISSVSKNKNILKFKSFSQMVKLGEKKNFMKIAVIYKSHNKILFVISHVSLRKGIQQPLG
jgi:PAB1-binding protein PBP1